MAERGCASEGNKREREETRPMSRSHRASSSLSFQESVSDGKGKKRDAEAANRSLSHNVLLAGGIREELVYKLPKDTCVNAPLKKKSWEGRKLDEAKACRQV